MQSVCGVYECGLCYEQQMLDEPINHKTAGAKPPPHTFTLDPHKGALIKQNLKAGEGRGE